MKQKVWKKSVNQKVWKKSSSIKKRYSTKQKLLLCIGYKLSPRLPPCSTPSAQCKAANEADSQTQGRLNATLQMLVRVITNNTLTILILVYETFLNWHSNFVNCHTDCITLWTVKLDVYLYKLLHWLYNSMNCQTGCISL